MEHAQCVGESLWNNLNRDRERERGDCSSRQQWLCWPDITQHSSQCTVDQCLLSRNTQTSWAFVVTATVRQLPTNSIENRFSYCFVTFVNLKNCVRISVYCYCEAKVRDLICLFNLMILWPYFIKLQLFLKWRKNSLMICNFKLWNEN